MNLHNFLQEISTGNTTFFQEKPVICFVAKEYPLLFFSLIKKIINGTNPELLQSIDSSHKLADLKAQCETHFLGMHRVYWFGDSNSLPKAMHKKWVSYFSLYAGPNTIMFFAQKDSITKRSKQWSVIELPDLVDKKLFTILLALYGSENKLFVKQLFAKENKFTLDTACLFAQYAQLIGKNTDDFFSTWFNRLHVSDTSLFLLSQYFFAKDKNKFYHLWARVYDQFSPPFWTTFWSEQLWRSAQFTQSMQIGDRLKAKRISYKLPFSFINRDWRNFKTKELAHAHDALYRCDYALKNGAQPYVFDVFYTKFFRNQFA